MAHQQHSLGGLFSSADYGTEIKKMRAIAVGIRNTPMPAEIPLSKAEDMYLQTLKASGRFVDEGIKMHSDIGNLLAAESIFSTVRIVQHDQKKMNDRLFYSIIRPARAAGQTMVPSAPFKRETSALLMSVVFGFEALEDIDAAKAWWMRGADFGIILSFMVLAGRAANAVSSVVYEPLRDALKAATSATEMLITAMKWGSIAGGLYLLYGALKPEKAKR